MKYTSLKFKIESIVGKDLENRHIDRIIEEMHLFNERLEEAIETLRYQDIDRCHECINKDYDDNAL